MTYHTATYTLNYDPLDQQINFEGVLRPIIEDNEFIPLLRNQTRIL